MVQHGGENITKTVRTLIRGFSNIPSHASKHEILPCGPALHINTALNMDGFSFPFFVSGFFICIMNVEACLHREEWRIVQLFFLQVASNELKIPILARFLQQFRTQLSDLWQVFGQWNPWWRWAAATWRLLNQTSPVFLIPNVRLMQHPSRPLILLNKKRS